jgi:hypothetical protein
MKKALLSLVGIGVLALAMVAGAHEPPGEITLAVNFPPGNEPRADGDPSEWDAIPRPPYAITSDELFSHFGLEQRERDGATLARGEVDLASLDTEYLLGWSDSKDRVYYVMRVFDDRHVTQRQELGRFYWDDAIETFFLFNHISGEEVRALNDGGFNSSIELTFVVPPIEDTWQYPFCRACTDWLSSGGDFFTFGWSFTGEQFGESTYFYELDLKAKLGYPAGLGDALTAADVENAELNEGDIIHYTISLGDVDGGEGIKTAETGDLRAGGYWSTTSGGDASWLGQHDLLLAPVDDTIDFPTAVESASWGRIKAQF